MQQQQPQHQPQIQSSKNVIVIKNAKCLFAYNFMAAGI